MAEIDTTGAMEPSGGMLAELDQPQDDAVSLDALLDDEPTDEDGGEQENVVADDDQQAESDAPQPAEPKSEKVLTQADFNKAFAARAAELRKQFMRERAEDFELAGIAREYFNGKTAQEIDEELMSVEAARLAAETGWDEEEALKKVRARHSFMRRGSANEPDPKVVQNLQKQLVDIKKEYGINFLEIVQADPFLSEAVDSGRMDINRAFAHYAFQQKTGAQSAKPAQKKAPPNVEKSSTSGGFPATREITEKEFRKINDALKSGRPVRV